MSRSMGQAPQYSTGMMDTAVLAGPSSAPKTPPRGLAPPQTGMAPPQGQVQGGNGMVSTGMPGGGQVQNPGMAGVIRPAVEAPRAPMSGPKMARPGGYSPKSGMAPSFRPPMPTTPMAGRPSAAPVGSPSVQQRPGAFGPGQRY